MSDLKATPGPWRAKSPVTIVGRKRHERFDGSVTEYEGDIAKIQPISSQEGGETTRLANAHLIAAAPALYAMLVSVRETISNQIDEVGDDGHLTLHAALNDIDTTLKLARGEA